MSKPQTSRRSDDPRRIPTLFLAGGLFLGAAYSQARVHVISGPDILKKAQATKRFVVGRTEFGKRGAIYSADGKPLAQSDDTYELSIDFSKVPKSSGFFMELSEASGLPASEMEQPARAGERSKVWREHMNSDQARDVQVVKAAWRADGVSLRKTLHREYPLGEATGGLVGLMREGVSPSGLEMSQNPVLKGVDGYTEGLIDRTGAFLPMRMTDESRKKQNGESITLTIDSNLQVAASHAIRNGVQVNKATSGVAIVLDPRTGDILAMANWPTLDPEGKTPDQTISFNPNYMGAYEPGSTFKILTLAEALEKGKVKDGDAIHCKGELWLNNSWRIRCDSHHGNRAHGETDLQKAIAKSCNVSAATWALRVGYADMVKYLEDLGLLTKTKLGVPLERAGSFNRNEYAKPLQIANVGFGQAVTATPIALISAFSMIANDGIRMQPRLIKSVSGRETPILPGTRIVQPAVANDVLKLMESVIESDIGTGAKLRIAGYRMAGKTGTAQKTDSVTHKVGGSAGYVSSFVGMIPADQPKAVILVMVDHPTGTKIYGADVAGPVFVDVAKAVIRHFNIPASANTGPIQSKPAKVHP